jgi:hypothetical protein
LGQDEEQSHLGHAGIAQPEQPEHAGQLGGHFVHFGDVQAAQLGEQEPHEGQAGHLTQDGHHVHLAHWNGRQPAAAKQQQQHAASAPATGAVWGGGGCTGTEDSDEASTRLRSMLRPA